MIFAALGVVNRHDAEYEYGAFLVAWQYVNTHDLAASKRGMQEYLRRCGAEFIGWGPMPSGMVPVDDDGPNLRVVS